MGNNQSSNLYSVENLYTPQEMTNASKIIPKNWTIFEDLKKTTSQTLSEALKNRQDFKDQNNPFKDYNTRLRKVHRPDLWY